MLFYPPIELFYFYFFYFVLISPIFFIFLSSEHQCYIGFSILSVLVLILLLVFYHAYVLLLEHCHFVCFQFF